MKKGQLLINGWDLYSHCGAYITAGGYRDVAAIAPMRKPNSVDWYEEDGIQVDLSNPSLESKEVKMSLATNKGWSGYDKLMQLLLAPASSAYLNVEMNEIARTRALRFLSSAIQRRDAKGEPFLFTLAFQDETPDPEIPIVTTHLTTPPIGTPIAEEGLDTIDDKPFSQFGIRLLNTSSLRQFGAIKTPMARTIHSQGIVIQDPQNPYTPHLKTYEARIRILMTAPSPQAFWENRDPFVRALIQPELRKLKIQKKTFLAYYASSQISQFSVLKNRDVFAQMELNFVITGTQTL